MIVFTVFKDGDHWTYVKQGHALSVLMIQSGAADSHFDREKQAQVRASQLNREGRT